MHTSLNKRHEISPRTLAQFQYRNFNILKKVKKDQQLENFIKALAIAHLGIVAGELWKSCCEKLGLSNE